MLLDMVLVYGCIVDACRDMVGAVQKAKDRDGIGQIHSKLAPWHPKSVGNHFFLELEGRRALIWAHLHATVVVWWDCATGYGTGLRVHS